MLVCRHLHAFQPDLERISFCIHGIQSFEPMTQLIFILGLRILFLIWSFILDSRCFSHLFVICLVAQVPLFCSIKKLCFFSFFFAVTYFENIEFSAYWFYRLWTYARILCILSYWLGLALIFCEEPQTLWSIFLNSMKGFIFPTKSLSKLF